jgi:hypothetical protein
MSAPRTAAKVVGGFVALCIVGGTVQSVLAHPVEYRDRIVTVTVTAPPQVITKTVEVPVPTQVPGPRRTVLTPAALPESCTVLAGTLEDFDRRSLLVSEDGGELERIVTDLARETVGHDLDQLNALTERVRTLKGTMSDNQLAMLEANRAFTEHYALCRKELSKK